ncbi:hypothetical protein LZ31DRAFT_554188 [Colletotrichum somersetense]|nr:hypothetical protein LZ31DRAFT_554188 [Colletotrichum somersetense]
MITKGKGSRHKNRESDRHFGGRFSTPPNSLTLPPAYPPVPGFPDRRRPGGAKRGDEVVGKKKGK